MKKTHNDSVEIEPIPFRSSRPLKRPKLFIQHRWFIAVTAGLIFVLLSASAWYVFTAKQVTIQIDPEPDELFISGSLIAPRLGNYYLLRPGEYSLRAIKPCYRHLDHDFEVRDENSQQVRLSMEKLGGRFSLTTNRSDQPSVKVEGARVYVDGQDIGTAPIEDMEVDSGQRHLEVRAENYQVFKTDVFIEGCGVLQSFDFGLLPGWSDVFVSSIPPKANVLIDGNPAGTTPLEMQLLEGTHRVEITATGFKTWTARLDVVANQPQSIKDVRLERADGILALQTNPPGANVMVGDTFVGQTPVKIPLAKNTDHDIRISKTGYETISRKVQVAAAESKELAVKLKPLKGIIHFIVEPSGAELIVDGKSVGPVPPKLKLIATQHELQLKKEGYQSYRTKITPRVGFPQELRITLLKKGERAPEKAERIKTKNGYSFKLVRPAAFTMGSSRREQGRRSNETLRKVQLQRPFFMGVREVTNGDFRGFLSGHKSGDFKGHGLSGKELPVVHVTWQQAAMFCNWLSARESLPPAYVKKGDKILATEPLGIGYRLPTEAEWEYCARFKGSKASLKYPWGNRFPPKIKAGNYADASAKDLLSSYLEQYDDGFPVTAPPGNFHANDLGLFDMGGNVAEWCHDYYSIYSYNDKVYLDPLGPHEGKHHVVRGSSWKDSSMSALRLSYRDYSNDKRPDLGFRVCRYLQ
ncbi:MAG: PEGA domain-containing protein [Deltaproteobacteria bacterium]|nr:PEGA domain-containing protein [Deltaproteobacteria bacterium]